MQGRIPIYCENSVKMKIGTVDDIIQFISHPTTFTACAHISLSLSVPLGALGGGCPQTPASAFFGVNDDVEDKIFDKT
ncbi:hypothetical protein DMENIID0001_071910 [Sergentomyia squamirostris]